jgi:hypothetical protein
VSGEAPSRLTATHGARAATAAAVALGLADAALALRKSPGPPLESALFVAGVVAVVALALAPLAALGSIAIRTVISQSKRTRTAAGSVAGLVGGVALGFAAFSGSAMLRSAARPWLIAASALACAVIGALSSRALDRVSALIDRRCTVVATLLAVAATLIAYGHATLLVRLYPALHALAALGAAALATGSAALAMKPPSAARSNARTASIVALGLLASLASADLLRSQRGEGEGAAEHRVRDVRRARRGAADSAANRAGGGRRRSHRRGAELGPRRARHRARHSGRAAMGPPRRLRSSRRTDASDRRDRARRRGDRTRVLHDPRTPRIRSRR